MQEEDIQGAKYAALAAVYGRHKVVKHSIPKFSSLTSLDFCILIRHRLEISNACENKKNSLSVLLFSCN